MFGESSPKARAKKDGEDKYPSPSFLFDFDFFLHVYLFPLQVVGYIFHECYVLVWNNLGPESVLHQLLPLQGDETLIDVGCDVRVDV